MMEERGLAREISGFKAVGMDEQAVPVLKL